MHYKRSFSEFVLNLVHSTHEFFVSCYTKQLSDSYIHSALSVLEMIFVREGIFATGNSFSSQEIDDIITAKTIHQLLICTLLHCVLFSFQFQLGNYKSSINV
jgi:hypothetical protein